VAIALDSAVAGFELEDVSVRFGSVLALDSVSLSADPGEVCGLIGPNGAGKTTLFDVISGIRAPHEGRIRLGGLDFSQLRSSDRARLGLRRTFQRVQVFGWLSVEDNVLAALEWRGGGGGVAADMVGFPSRKRRERERRAMVRVALDRCGLSEVRNELAGSLPIGLARMVEFARATVEAPRLLLLDEPASGLDATEAVRLGELIQAVRAEADCSIVVVEHDAGFIMEHCDRVVVLAQGSVLAEGSPDQVRNDPDVRSAYLGDALPADVADGPSDDRRNGEARGVSVRSRTNEPGDATVNPTPPPPPAKR
jgi:branched-chain amino acid transport system ATP-binding protein